MEYDGEKDQLRANTRNGSKLIYDKASLLEALESGYLGKYRPNSGDTWERFVRSKFAGFIQARLYNGS